MSNFDGLPVDGFLRLWHIIGQEAVTEEQAEKNRVRGKGPKRPKPAIPPIIPVKKSTWWSGVKSGRYPKPVRTLGVRITAWRVEDIRALIQQTQASEKDK